MAVLAGGLRRQPLADVTGIAAGVRGERLGRRRSELDERPVQPELVAEHDGPGVQHRGEVAEELPGELLDRVGRCRHRLGVLDCRGHVTLRSFAGWSPDGCDDRATDPAETLRQSRRALQGFCRVRRRGWSHERKHSSVGTSPHTQGDVTGTSVTTTPTTTGIPTFVTAVVDRFLDAVESGRGAELARRLRRRRRSRRDRAELAVLGHGRDGDRRRVRAMVLASRPLRGARSARHRRRRSRHVSAGVGRGRRAARQSPLPRVDHRRRASTAAASSPTTSGAVGAGRRRCSPRWRPPDHGG